MAFRGQPLLDLGLLQRSVGEVPAHGGGDGRHVDLAVGLLARRHHSRRAARTASVNGQ